MALVAPVSGAPGDGHKSLTAALKKRLFAGGVKLASAPARNVYTVKGTVAWPTPQAASRASASTGWCSTRTARSSAPCHSKTPSPKASLNGPWGAIADAAAGAAANGIIKLLPRSNT